MTEINLTPEAKQAAIENMMAENRRKIRDIQKTGVTITPESMESSKDRMFLNWMMNNLLDENQRMDFEISWQNFLLRELEKMKEKASDTVAEARRAELLRGTPAAHAQTIQRDPRGPRIL